MGLDEELWDILEDGVGDVVLDEEGAAVDRKIHTPAQKKMYKKHHKIFDSYSCLVKIFEVVFLGVLSYKVR